MMQNYQEQAGKVLRHRTTGKHPRSSFPPTSTAPNRLNQSIQNHWEAAKTMRLVRPEPILRSFLV
jgi:hypothetical protein